MSNIVDLTTFKASKSEISSNNSETDWKAIKATNAATKDRVARERNRANQRLASQLKPKKG